MTDSSNRPLSPHLQVYKPQLTSMLSIAHRATGIALALGCILLCYWLLSLAGGAQSYVVAQSALASGLGRVVLLGFTFAFFYHLCNGIRHLFWDAGYGFELSTVYRSGNAVLVVSVVATLLAWALAYAMRAS